MLKEAIDKIEQLSSPTCEIEEHSDRHVRVFNQETGSVKFEPSPPAPLGGDVQDLDSLVAAVERFGVDPTVWVNGSDAVAVFDTHNSDSDRRGRLKMDLGLSRLFHRISAMKNLSPKKMVKAIKFDLYTAVIEPVDLANRFASIKFEVNKELDVQTGQTDAAVSMKHRQKATGEGDIPETCTFTFDPYPNLDELGESAVTVKCIIQTDAEEATITIEPFPGEVEAAVKKARQMVVEWVGVNSSDDVTVFAGVLK